MIPPSPRFLLALVCSVVAFTAGAETIRLDGTWQFKLDPAAAGRTEQWYQPAAAFTDTIVVPGAWDAQGYGEETDKFYHNYIGKGWYKREVTIPSAADGARYFLRFGGVYRYASVWVNGAHVGDHVGYVSDFEFDITPHVTPGQTALVAIEIDSAQNWDIDALQGCADIIDHLFTYWGGIWGHIDLVVREKAWLSEHFVQPNALENSGVVTASLAGDVAGADRVQLDILDSAGTVVATKEASTNSSAAISIKADIPNGSHWTPEHPYLYTSRLSLFRGDAAVDVSTERFGLRTIEIQGSSFLVNGKKYFLAGYGDDAVYPETIVGPCDKDYYLERLKVAKQYGFNYVRHHSHFLPDEYYEACDEVGMFVSPELPIAYMRFYNRATEKGLALYESEWISAIKRYRNHPSIFDWCMGNEFWSGIPLGPRLYELAKGLDPTRPVIDTDGVFYSGPVHATGDRDTMDFYTVMFDILTMPLENPNKFVFSETKKPVISHETGNYVSFPRLSLIDEFKHNFKPFWLTVVRDKIAAAGLLEETDRWSDVSEKLYYFCHKTNLEAIRKNPLMSGYHWWLLQPWWPGSNGLVDAYRRPNSITPEAVRQINGPVVLLQDGLELTYAGNQDATVNLSVSNFSGADFAAGDVTWKARFDASPVAEGTLAAPAAANGALVSVGAITLALPNVDAPQRFHLDVSLTANETTYTNTWSSWVFPAMAPKPVLSVPLYVSDDLQGFFQGIDTKPFPATGTLPAGAVYVARQPTTALLDAAAAGSCVVLLSPVGLLPIDWTTYKTAWWLGVFEGDSNTGTYVYPNAVTRDFAPDAWCDPGWFNLLQGAQTFILDDLPNQPGVLIRALNTHSAPHPFSRDADFEFMWRNKALLFETRVGSGSMIVSGLNFEKAFRHGGPEGPWLLRKLVDYAGTLPHPDAEFSPEYLRTSVDTSPFAKANVVSGFDQLVKHVGPTSKRQTYREFEAECLDIRQEEPLHRIEWLTAPTAEAVDTVFVFAGGFPFMPPPHINPGFGLAVNGTRALVFDTTKTGTEWASDDGTITLRFVPTHFKSSWGDITGLFYLSVPGDRLKAGEPARLEVKSIGSDNARWFGLAPYTDILTPEVAND